MGAGIRKHVVVSVPLFYVVAIFMTETNGRKWVLLQNIFKHKLDKI